MVLYLYDTPLNFKAIALVYSGLVALDIRSIWDIFKPPVHETINGFVRIVHVYFKILFYSFYITKIRKHETQEQKYLYQFNFEK